jgi:hypothetical protein
MEVWLAVSGMLALLGGGAGAVAYYRKNYGTGATSTSADGTPDYDLGPTTPINNPVPTALGIPVTKDTQVSAADGIVETLDPAGNIIDVSAGIVSPIPVGLSRSSVLPATNAPVDTASTGPAAAAAATVLAQTKAKLARVGL